MHNGKYIQSIYKPIHPEKYEGNVLNIICRSSWERKFCIWCDKNPNIVAWSSEEMIIPYYDPATKKTRRYFPDFRIKVRVNETTIMVYLVEIKPSAQTQKPKAPKRTTPKTKQRYINECLTYITNQAKWYAAEEYCTRRNWGFKVLTEHDLGIYK